MVRVHIITQNEPFFIPKMIEHILLNQKKEFNIVSYTVLKPHRKNKSLFDWFKERAKVYSYFELLIASFAFVYVKIVSKLPSIGTFYSIRKIFDGQDIREIKSSDINSNEYIHKLKTVSPDVIISISCPQIFKKDILEVPTEVCINAHGTLLPRHRGVFGTWWTLFCNDKEAGGTIHTMELKLDAGHILWQESFDVAKSDTQFSLAYKTKKIMAEGIVEVLIKINNGKLERKIAKFEESYHRAPTKKLGVEFHKKGNRVIRVNDISKMLAKSF